MRGSRRRPPSPSASEADRGYNKPRPFASPLTTRGHERIVTTGWEVPDRKGDLMGLDDKIKNAAEDLTGKAKEGVGKATDNERLEAEGQGDQTKANLKQAGENVKDAFK